MIRRMVCAVALGIGVLSALAVTAAVALGGGLDGSTAGGPTGTSGGLDRPAVPAAWITLYRQAAARCPGLPWSVLAGIGTVESRSGRSDAAGVWSGANPAGAEGPMQFEPATFAAYATVGPGGERPASPYDPVDAVFTASALLCADGGSSPSTLRTALTAYDHSDAYADTVLTLSLAFEDVPGTSVAAAGALSFAARQLGVPYRWGGTGDGGFDCSGLVQTAYLSAGVALPRTAQAQFDTGPRVPGGQPLDPGDLVFFGPGPTRVDHVGIYDGAGWMIDAPHTGADVRFDDVAWPDLVGATRPG